MRLWCVGKNRLATDRHQLTVDHLCGEVDLHKPILKGLKPAAENRNMVEFAKDLGEIGPR